MKEPVYIKLFLDYLDAVDALSDVERGRLFTALLKYGRTGEAPQLTGNERFIFPLMKAQIDRDFAAWREKDEDMHEIRKEAGRKGGLARASKAKQTQANQANASKAKQIKHKTTDYGLLTTDDLDTPPYPPCGGEGDAPGASAPVPDKPTRRERTPDSLTPDEEAALLAFSPGLCDAVRDWLRYHVEIKKPYTETGRQRLIAGIAREAQTHGANAVCALIDHAMRSRYQGIPWDKLSQPPYGGPGGGRNDAAEWAQAFEMVHAALEGRTGK